METPAHQLTVHLFGYPDVEVDGRSVRLPRRKAVALLAYVSVRPAGVGRQVLAALLWPDYDPEQAFAYLRQALWEMNKALGKGLISAEGDTVGIDPRADLWVDVVRFERALSLWKLQSARGASDATRSLEEAASLYREDFMAGFTLRDSAPFDEWQSAQAEALRRQLGEALAALARVYADQGDQDMAIASVQRWLAIDPLDESAHRDAMRFYAWAGQRRAALRQYETCISQLKNELGAAPEKATMALYEEIRSGSIAHQGGVAPSAPSPSSFVVSPVGGAPPTSSFVVSPVRGAPSAPSSAQPSLAAATPFVGRESELQELGRILADPDCRLLTLVGPGGIGKTRVAVQFLATHKGAYSDGVAVAPLAECRSAEQMVAAIAQAVQLAFRPQSSALPALDQECSELSDYLRARTMLLLLDDMEHLVGAAPLLRSLLAQAPGLNLLVTSRERLALPEEWVMELQGLPTAAPVAAEQNAASSAEQLFERCAWRVRVGLPLPESERPAIRRICELVGGVPLGIELAAAWVGTLSCREIAAELERDMDLLVSRQRDAPGRHASLRAVFDHSWALLSDAERNAFCQLAVFQGGFTRSAAAQVAHASLEMLSVLLDKSLVYRVAPPAKAGGATLPTLATPGAGDQGRYSIHQVLHQYADEALGRTPGLRDAALERQRSYYLDLLEAEGQHLMGSAERESLVSLRLEASNVRLALQTTVQLRDWERLQQVLPFWILCMEMCGSRSEATEALRPVASAAREAWAHDKRNITLRGLLSFLLAAQRYFASQGDPAVLEELARESVILAAELPDSVDKAFALILNSTGYGLPMAEALAVSRQCLEIFRRFGHIWGQATAQLIVADITNYPYNEHAQAEPAYQAARMMFESLGNRWGQALCLTGLSYVAYHAEQYAQAIQMAQKSLSIYRELGDPWRMGILRSYLAQYAAAMGDYAAAERYHHENLAAAMEHGQRSEAAALLSNLGYLAHLGRDDAAARDCYERSLAAYRELGDAQGVEHIAQVLKELS